MAKSCHVGSEEGVLTDDVTDREGRAGIPAKGRPRHVGTGVAVAEERVVR